MARKYSKKKVFNFITNKFIPRLSWSNFPLLPYILWLNPVDWLFSCFLFQCLHKGPFVYALKSQLKDFGVFGKIFETKQDFCLNNNFFSLSLSWIINKQLCWLLTTNNNNIDYSIFAFSIFFLFLKSIKNNINFHQMNLFTEIMFLMPLMSWEKRSIYVWLFQHEKT